MKFHERKRLYLVAAVLGAVAVFTAVFFVALAVRSVVADPGASAPNPGHEWSEVEGHGIDGGDYWLGTTVDQALELWVNNDRALRLEPNAESPNLIGGYSGNSVTGGVYGATIAGGGADQYRNQVTDDYGVVGGGRLNLAGNDADPTDDASYATVGGGTENTASGWAATVGGGQFDLAQEAYATVGGGLQNTASGWAATISGGWDNEASERYATVGGGYSNDATHDYATVGGGYDNTASGDTATVLGGQENVAAGAWSLAAGRFAKIDPAHSGSFLFADANDFDFDSAAANEFAVRSTGGSRIVTAIDGTGTPTAGVKLDPGDSAWEVLSDRDAKENFVVLDAQDVLNRLAGIPITEWNYKTQDPSNRHIGPMAQDFYAAFGLSADEFYISPIDTDGVALAAIQGLYELSQEQAARIQALEGENASLQQQLDGLEARNAALEGEGGVSGGSAGPLSSSFTAGGLLLGGLLLGGLVLVQRRRTGGRS